jgi:oligogalacturonide lyase
MIPLPRPLPLAVPVLLPSPPPRCHRGRLLWAFLALAATAAAAPEPPSSWIDPDTGHRVIRMTREPNSLSFYFNDNAYTPDGREMVYTTPAGISVLNLATLEARPVVPGPVRAIVVGRKTPTIYYTKRNAAAGTTTLYATNVDTGATRAIGDLPGRGSIDTINSDETLAAGTLTEGAGLDYGGNARASGQAQSAVQPVNKLQMMKARLARRLPMALFTLDLRTGQTATIRRGTDWMNHLQFSPSDPTLLMYAHEGPWQLVDRIWNIRTDGTQNRLIHQRTVEMEQDGHEWWSQDGRNIWYDLRMPEGVLSLVSGYNVVTGERSRYHVERYAWSIHYNASPDGTLFCGDGCGPEAAWWASAANKWIYLLRPQRIPDDHSLGSGLIHPGVMHAERLVNLAKHGYLLEPNPSFTPDQKLIVFRSNLFGPTYVFGVEVAPTAPATAAGSNPY